MTDTALKALIFDVDGTLADTESAHLAAFNQAFAELGLDWHWDDAIYTELLNISGGKQRLQHYWRLRYPDVLVIDAQAMQDTIDRIHELKTAYFEAAVGSGSVQLRPGVLALINQAHTQQLSLAIASTTALVNIAVLLRAALGSNWRQYFAAVCDTSEALVRKPDPQVYLQMLATLGLPAAAALAFEDSGNGLRAARAAGLATIITPTRFTQQHDFSAALRVLPDLDGVTLAQLIGWHSGNAAAYP